MIQCNNCGYPVIKGMHTCPNCLAEMPDEIVSKMHMIPARNIDEALTKAKELLGRENITVTAIPDGVSVIVK